MRIELNNTEYTHILGSKALKCKFCSLRHVLIGICVSLCRTGRIFRLNEYRSDIFNL